MKNMQYFYWGKTRSKGSNVFTNFHILHAEDTHDITGDLKHELKMEEMNLGLQRMQNNGVVKVGHVLGMIDKINLQECTDYFQNLLCDFFLNLNL